MECRADNVKKHKPTDAGTWMPIRWGPLALDAAQGHSILCPYVALDDSAARNAPDSD